MDRQAKLAREVAVDGEVVCPAPFDSATAVSSARRSGRWRPSSVRTEPRNCDWAYATPSLLPRSIAHRGRAAASTCRSGSVVMDYQPWETATAPARVLPRGDGLDDVVVAHELGLDEAVAHFCASALCLMQRHKSPFVPLEAVAELVGWDAETTGAVVDACIEGEPVVFGSLQAEWMFDGDCPAYGASGARFVGIRPAAPPTFEQQ